MNLVVTSRDILGHCSGEKNNLGGLREKLEDVVDLLGETTLTIR